ncbi:ATP-binding protein [Priestia taiwanensis]|uniref:histidine kinase n=1 Tax=Priestia taiwanensis TaxID=1347902 RepID=A0A917EKU8_9BACI|nr:ATP-binding protein [Priestia taiwanensis]MBM7361566.1 two-component system sensor histidine kinase ResE [Priestia taiwanensis]GGE55218.1 sensor histidine kinase [Priestia taiwanensis]
MLWRSVVGKLWFTILLLVSFVLAFLTILLTGYFETYYEKEVERRITENAERVVKMVHEDISEDLLHKFATSLMTSQARMTIVKEDGSVWRSDSHSFVSELSLEEIKENDELAKAFTERTKVITLLESSSESDQFASQHQVVIAMPISISGMDTVIIQHSLQEVENTSNHMIKFIFLSAGFAIILTTIFSFFLSTRITEPLRKMKEVAAEVATGKYDAKIPIVSKDEIGDLARAFNQMGRKLQFNINALKQQKAQLSSILSSMADGVITLSQKGEILLTNPPAQQFMQTWFLERGMQQLNNRNLPDELVQLFHNVVETESEQVIEVDMTKGNWVIIMTPLYNQTKVRGAVAVLRDMTEERRLDKMRTDFIANVSHELRTPMVMLQGYSEAILDGIASTEEEQHELVQIIYEESLRLGRLVNELLDLARMESGRVQLNMEEMNIQAFVEKITRKFQGIAKDKNIHLEATFMNDVTTHVFDGDRVEQVLTNLIDNAIRHTPDEGSVTLFVEEKQEGIQFQVTDTGSGIPEEDLSYVFERFYKADKARTRGRAGTGLGLAIAKNIVDAHAGKISVTSVYGEGTTFTVFLPNKEIG